jgi:hypothetical protein
MALRKLTVRAPKKAPSAVVKLLADNKDCADCDSASVSHVDVRFGVFVCADCAAAHRSVLGAAWVKDTVPGDTITPDETSYLTSMG